MIGSTRQVTVWAYGAPADLRKGFDGLSGLVTQRLEQDPLSGDCYLFVNATRKRAKVLLWDGTGLCIYAKRLERGRFACLWRDAKAAVVRLTMSELQLFLEGSTLVGCGFRSIVITRIGPSWSAGSEDRGHRDRRHDHRHRHRGHADRSS